MGGYIYAVIDFIESARQNNGRIFLHCLKGISRSPAFAISYMIYHKNFSFDEAFQYLRKARMVVNPNPGFVFQISEWEQNRRNTVQAVFCIESRSVGVRGCERIVSRSEKKRHNTEEVYPIINGPIIHPPFTRKTLAKDSSSVWIL